MSGRLPDNVFVHKLYVALPEAPEMSNVQVGIRMFLVNRFDKTSFVCLFQGWDKGTRANPGPPTPLPDRHVGFCRVP